MKRKSWSGKSWNNKDLRSFALVLTYEDIAELLGITVANLHQRLKRGTIRLSGEAIKDFKYLQEKVEDELTGIE